MKSKVPHLLYITLLAVFFIITGSSFFISCSRWNNIVVGIGSGGIASVIVAWLIDFRNNKKQEIESKAKYEAIIMQFVDIYKRLLWVTANECNISIEGEEWSFYDWLQFLKDIASNCPKDGQQSMNTRCSRISSNIVLLQEQIKTFQLQSVTLILGDFPNEKECQSFFQIQNAHCFGTLMALEREDYVTFCDTTYILFNEFYEKFTDYQKFFPEKYNIKTLQVYSSN